MEGQAMMDADYGQPLFKTVQNFPLLKSRLSVTAERISKLESAKSFINLTTLQRRVSFISTAPPGQRVIRTSLPHLAVPRKGLTCELLEPCKYNRT